jgi:hypothetical protein
MSRAYRKHAEREIASEKLPASPRRAERHPFSNAFSPRRMAQANFDVRQQPTHTETPPPARVAQHIEAPRPAPVPNPPQDEWFVLGRDDAPRTFDDILFCVIRHLLRHEYDSRTAEEHITSESVLDCVQALCDCYEAQMEARENFLKRQIELRDRKLAAIQNLLRDGATPARERIP